MNTRKFIRALMAVPPAAALGAVAAKAVSASPRLKTYRTSGKFLKLDALPDNVQRMTVTRWGRGGAGPYRGLFLDAEGLKQCQRIAASWGGGGS